MFVALKKFSIDCGFCSAFCLVWLTVNSQKVHYYRMWGLWSTGTVILCVKMTKLTKSEKSSNILSGVINSNKILINSLKAGSCGLLFYLIAFGSRFFLERTLQAILNQQLQDPHSEVLQCRRLENAQSWKGSKNILQMSCHILSVYPKWKQIPNIQWFVHALQKYYGTQI